MASPKLPNYLRLHRKRLGFSEGEIAFLLGSRYSSKVSRYEQFRRVPSLETVLAYYVIFRTSSPELFGGKFQQMEREVRKRAKRLLRKLVAEPRNPAAARKIIWLSILSGEEESTAKT